VDSVNRKYDVVVVGGGHNGLVAASYLSRAGLAVLVLERLDHTGGAARSRYSSLVPPLPAALVADLGLDLRLTSRSIASYTPTLRDGKPGGLLVQRPEKRKTEKSFRELTGGDEEYAAWRRFHADAGDLARVVAPTLLQPLPPERVLRDQVDPAVWQDFVTHPLGETIEARFSDDTVRGVAAADALVGTFASMHDRSLAQNRGFLHHLLGNETGAWQVPVGGMAAVTDALAGSATSAGAEIITAAGVSAVRAGDDGAEVTWHDGSTSHTVAARFVLANVAPWVLSILLGHGEDAASKPEGALVTINLRLDRLPRFASGIDPATAFAGTLRLGQDYTDLAAAYDDAAAGRLPSAMPGRIQVDESAGTLALSYVGLHTPASLFEPDPEGAKAEAVQRALASLDQHLVEPIESCLATDAAGRPCLEARIPQDIERDLAMPGGNLFHGDLEWPWAPHRSRLETPAQQWGVQTDLASVLVCGSGSRRGGGLSGLGGHSAAHAVLASL
jgi:phytoene dehydrogenase-like protein